jgi:hypothetical protein
MTIVRMPFEGLCRTTAMGIMPHRDIEKALELALSLDIPFWPQLPNVGYYEDMYAQASEHFPGVAVDVGNKHISFDAARFEAELTDYSQKMADPSVFSLSEAHSVVYHRFLREDLRKYAAIRGQVIGPVSYGFKVMDAGNMPIIYNDQARPLLFDFIARKVNAQYHELTEKNPNAFVWLDEPGLGWVFSGLSGYSDMRAKEEYRDFLNALDGPPALHLCASVNLPYLLSLGVALLSFDAFQMEVMPKGYTQAVADYIAGGGIISWGIVPTDAATLAAETPETLTGRLMKYWDIVADNSPVSAKQIARQALVAPARCSLKNLGLVGAQDEKPKAKATRTGDSTIEETTVELAFDYLRRISRNLRSRLGI